MNAPRGQSLVLFALTLMLVTLMVCMTLSIGTTAARRTDLNNIADAAALSNAVATARTFNVSALLNRGMVAHYVSQSGIQAQMAYATRGASYFFQAGYQMRLYDFPASLGPIASYGDIEDGDNSGVTMGCAARTGETRGASYELWHRAYAFYRWNSGGGPLAGDTVNSGCASSGVCSTPRSWISPDGIAQAEEEAAKQGHRVHQAIWDLAEMQRLTLRKLEDKVRTNEFGREIADQAGVVSGRQFDGREQAKKELSRATGSDGSLTSAEGPDSDTYYSWRRPMGEAIMGARPKKPLVLPLMKENLAPLVVQALAIARAGLASTDLAGKFTVELGTGDTSADVSEDAPVDEASRREEPLGGSAAVRLQTGMRRLVARFKEGSIATTYRDSCAGGVTRTTTSGASFTMSVSNLKVNLPDQETTIFTANNAGVHVDGMHWLMGGSGCHGAHEHYGARAQYLVHALDDGEHFLPAEALGYVLPDASRNSPGARGAWGQPKLPLMVSQRSKAKNDPFNLTLRFQFSQATPAERFDMDSPIDTQVSAAAGIAYYHRRGHLGEPPNVLNPFWHASLVPMEIDERSRNDPTESSQAGRAMDAMLQDVTGFQGKADSRNAYRQLRSSVQGMEKTPARD